MKKKTLALFLCAVIGVALGALPGTAKAAVLTDVSVVKDHPLYSILLIETSSRVIKSEVRRSKTRANYVELYLRGVSQGKVEDRIRDVGGAVEGITVSYDRRAKRTKLGITLAPGVSANDVLKVAMDNKHSGNLALLIDLPGNRRTPFLTPLDIKSRKDRGQKIVIVDPGHGWIDPGASYYGMQEKTVVLDIAKRLANLINQSENMYAVLTRTGDYLPLMEKDDYRGTSYQVIKRALKARVDFARKMKGDVYVSLHLNSVSRRSRRAHAKGFELFILDEKTSDRIIDKEMEEIDLEEFEYNGNAVSSDHKCEETKLLFAQLSHDISTGGSRLLAQTIADSLRSVPRLVPREKTIVGRNFAVLRQLAMPSVLAELAFLSNREEASYLRKTDFRQRLAEHLYEGIAAYFTVDYEKYRSGDDRPFIPQPIVSPSEPPYPIHVVEKGESLFSIAKKYDTTSDYLKKINRLKRSTIHPKQELKVPIGSEVMSKTYIVRPGDSLAEIAAEHGMSTTQLKRLNNLRSNLIHPGDELAVNGQGRKSLTRTRPQSAKAAPKPPARVYYKVRKGDNLYTIAKRYKTTVPKIRRLSGLKSSRLQIGQKLRIK